MYIYICIYVYTYACASISLGKCDHCRSYCIIEMSAHRCSMQFEVDFFVRALLIVCQYVCMYASGCKYTKKLKNATQECT